MPDQGGGQSREGVAFTARCDSGADITGQRPHDLRDEAAVGARRLQRGCIQTTAFEGSQLKGIVAAEGHQPDAAAANIEACKTVVRRGVEDGFQRHTAKVDIDIVARKVVASQLNRAERQAAVEVDRGLFEQRRPAFEQVRHDQQGVDQTRQHQHRGGHPVVQLLVQEFAPRAR